MPGFTILHITDFHIRDAVASDELLRTSHYATYVRQLVTSYQDFAGAHELPGAIDIVIATGDFVDRGRVAQFDHARRIIDAVTSECGISQDRVVVCPGNHDFIRLDEKNGRHQEARAAYNAFAERFGNGTALERGPSWSLVRISSSGQDGCLVLSLDATAGCGGEDKPGILIDSEIDAISDAVQRRGRGQQLCIAAHYPGTADGFQPAAAHARERMDRHVWGSGSVLIQKLVNMGVCARPIIVFAGDVHQEMLIGRAGNVCITSGRFGTEFDGDGHDSLIHRQAVVVNTAHVADRLEVWLAQYDTKTHRAQGHTGRWEWNAKSVEIIGTPEIVVPSRIRPNKGANKTLGKAAPPTPELATPTLLNEALQEEIIDLISNGLYHLGRFAGSASDMVPMAWVRMGPILNDPGIPVQLLAAWEAKIRAWTGVGGTDAVSSAAVFGIDMVGATLGSRLAALLGTRFGALSMRPRATSTEESQRTSAMTAAGGTNKRDYAILITDVVQTGNTVREARRMLSTFEGSTFGGGTRWMLLSICCDGQSNHVQIPQDMVHITACRDLRLPLLRRKDLPAENVLPVVRNHPRAV